MDAILDPGAFSDQERAAAQELPATSRLRIGDPDRKQIHAQQLRELAGINGIRLRAGLPNQLDMKGMGHSHGVLVLGQPRREPLPIERRLGADGDRRRELRQPREHRLDGRRQLTHFRNDLAGGIERAGGDVALMEIEANERHERLPRRLR